MNSLLELFGGRFDSSDMEYLMRTHHNDKRVVADYLLTSKGILKLTTTAILPHIVDVVPSEERVTTCDNITVQIN